MRFTSPDLVQTAVLSVPIIMCHFKVLIAVLWFSCVSQQHIECFLTVPNVLVLLSTAEWPQINFLTSSDNVKYFFLLEHNSATSASVLSICSLPATRLLQGLLVKHLWHFLVFHRCSGIIRLSSPHSAFSRQLSRGSRSPKSWILQWFQLLGFSKRKHYAWV